MQGNDLVIYTYEIHQIHITYYWLVHINIVVISTWIYAVCSQHVMNCWMEIHCYQYIGNTRYMFTCYSCCIEMTLIVSVWISFLLVSAEFYAVWVSILVNISLEFVGLTIFPSFANCRCILILTCDPHACRYGQNMFFYNCQICKQILIIVLNKMQSF